MANSGPGTACIEGYGLKPGEAMAFSEEPFKLRADSLPTFAA